jgi:hypothetical protein
MVTSNKNLALDFIEQAKTKKYNINPAQAEIRILDYIMENRLDESILRDLTKEDSLKYMYSCVFCTEGIKPPEGIDSLATVTREYEGKKYMFTMCKDCTKSYFDHKAKLYNEEGGDMRRKKLDRNRNSEYGKYLPTKPIENLGFDKADKAVKKKINQYVETGLLVNFESYTHAGSNSHHCVFCHLNLADLPTKDARKIELIAVPVGQSSTIHGPVKCCPTCSAYKRVALTMPNLGHFNQIKSVTCSITGKPYSVTLEEYNSNDYSGNLLVYGSTGFMSQQAARENWGKPRFEYPTCTGCSRTFVRDKLFLSDKDTKICAECRKKNMDMGKSKLPNVPQSQISNTNLITHIVSFDEAIGCIISEVVCSRGSTSFILTFIIKLDFMNKVIDNLGEDVYNEFIESLPFTIKDKEQRLIEDLSSFFERCPDRDYCYCNSSVEAAAYDAGITYANKIHSQEYEKNLKTLLNRINEQ